MSKIRNRCGRTEKIPGTGQNSSRKPRKGDEEARESLTLEDIDTYSMISRRIVHENLFTIVDTYFMPYGKVCE